MRHILSVLAVTTAFGAAPAGATIYSTSFSGIVTSQAATSFGVGQSIAGSFTYSTDSSQFLSFQIGGFSATAPFVSQVTTVPSGVIAPFSATYSASVSAAQTGGSINRSFTLDLEALNTLPTNNPLTLLTTPNLTGQLDLNPADSPLNSTFSYFNGNANGTGVTRVTAALTAISTQVPEPATLALLAAPLAALLVRRRA